MAKQAVSNDEDLFSGLVEQYGTNDIRNEMNSESMLPTCTQQPHSDSSTNQFVDKDDSQSMESHPDSLSNDDVSILHLMCLNK